MGKGGKRMKRRYLCSFHRLGKAVWDWRHRHPGNIAMELSSLDGFDDKLQKDNELCLNVVLCKSSK